MALARVLLQIAKDLQDLLIAQRIDPVDRARPVRIAVRNIGPHIELHHGVRIGVKLQERRLILVYLLQPLHNSVAYLVAPQRPQHLHGHPEQVLEIVEQMRRLLKDRELVIALSYSSYPGLGRQLNPRVIIRSKKRCHNILRPLGIHGQMVLRIGLVELFDRLHRISHQIILPPENLPEINCLVAAAVSPCEQENCLLLPFLEHNLQNIHPLAILV